MFEYCFNLINDEMPRSNYHQSFSSVRSDSAHAFRSSSFLSVKLHIFYKNFVSFCRQKISFLLKVKEKERGGKGGRVREREKREGGVRGTEGKRGGEKERERDIV